MSERPALTVRLARWASDLRNHISRVPGVSDVVLDDEEATELSTLLTEAANEIARFRFPSGRRRLTVLPEKDPGDV